MEVYIENRQSKIDIDEGAFDVVRKVVKECLLEENKDLNVEVSVSFVDNKGIHSLNKTYRNVDSETDVLSFPMENQLNIPIVPLGDIIISLEKALEQSKNFGHSFVREVAYLTAHSMFHLLGYDHETSIEEKNKMREKEKKVMKKLKIFKDCD